MSMNDDANMFDIDIEWRIYCICKIMNEMNLSISLLQIVLQKSVQWINDLKRSKWCTANEHFLQSIYFSQIPGKNLKNWPNIKSWKVDSSGMSKGKEMLYFSPATLQRLDKGSWQKNPLLLDKSDLQSCKRNLNW